MGSTTIKPFPELVELATREATDIQVRMGMMLSGVGVEALRSAVLAQLCDLTRPASRDAVARLVAKRIGWVVSDVVAAIDWNWQTYLGLHRSAGMDDPNRWERHPPAPEALALIVRHLWPDEARRG